MSAGGLRPRLAAVWVLFLALAAAIVAIEVADRGGISEPEGRAEGRDPRLLLPVPLEQVSAIEVAHAGSIHRFERDAAGTWFYHGAHARSDAGHMHQPDPVLAQRIESALQGFGRARMERTLSIDQGVERYGLAVPQMLILAYRPKEVQPLLQVAVGDVAPDTFSRYVMVVGSSSVVTIANFQIDNLLELVKAAVESGQGQEAIARP